MGTIKLDLTGDKYGRWTVLYEAESTYTPGGRRIRNWMCECSCENHTKRIVTQRMLRSGESSSCGCYRLEQLRNKIKIDMIGQKFGKLTVISEAEPTIDSDGHPILQYNCKCDCGNKDIIISGVSLRSGNTKSCGCIIHEYREKVGVRKINDFEINGDYTIVKTFDGDSFIIDTEDIEKIKNYCWHISLGYPSTTERQSKRRIRLNRFLMNLDDDCNYVDHINHNKKDNRKCNLRIVTPQQNSFNKSEISKNSSGFRGVSWCKERNKWEAKIGYNGKTIHLGRYENIEDAILARKKAEEKYFEEYSFNSSVEYSKKYLIDDDTN